jgi:SAM-dependent methyltransferase
VPPYDPSYDLFDAGIYDHVHTGVEGDVAFYVEEARKAGGPVLELGCGTGRILIPIAEAGIDIVGLDLSRNMLAVLREKLAKQPDEVQRRVELVEGDMRTFALGRRFPLAMIPYRAFLHLMTIDDQMRALTTIREHLVDGGRLALNFFDPNLAYIVERQLDGGAPRKNAAFTNPATGRLTVGWDSFDYDTTRQWLDGYFTFDEYDASGAVVSTRRVPLRLRWVYQYEMQHLFERAGFAIEALYGDFQRGAFKAGGEQVWIARRV